MKKVSLSVCLTIFLIMFTPLANSHVEGITIGSDAVNTSLISPPVPLPIFDARDDTATTDEDNPITIHVLSNDQYTSVVPPTVTSVSVPSSGTAVINADNTINYAPNPDFFGSDSFDYTISDTTGLLTDTASVFVTVKEVNDFTIKKVQSGLVSFDPLNNETKTMAQLQATNGTYWTYAGSANTLFNPPAPRDLFKDSQGLHIGVQTPTNGTFAGYFAVTPHMNASLFHAVMGIETRTIPSNFFINGLYVQTFNGLINYVTCVSDTGILGTSWHLVRSEGNTTFATKIETLWSDSSPNQPLTRECTIITNGDNYLKLYMDGVKVFESNTLSLKMPGPFHYFLEPQNSHATMLYGIYRDFYITSDERMQVISNPPIAARVDIVDPLGNVLASSPVVSGTASLDIGMYHFPLAANIKVYDINNIVIASTSSPASIFGGDIYSVSK